MTGRLRVPSSGRDQGRSRGRLPSGSQPDAGPRTVQGARPLPDAVRARMERAFGADFSSVVVRQDDTATAMEALAYTRGEVITVRPGWAGPHTPQGQELLGHELAHVVQQRNGRVGGAGLTEDPSLEAEADEAGDRVARGEPVVAGAGGPAQGTGPGAAAQPKKGLPTHAEMKMVGRLLGEGSPSAPGPLGTARLGGDGAGRGANVALPLPGGRIEVRGAHEAAHALQPPDPVAYRRSQRAHPFAPEG